MFSCLYLHPSGLKCEQQFGYNMLKMFTNLWKVFGGDLKVQLAIDVDFPEVFALVKIPGLREGFQ